MEIAGESAGRSETGLGEALREGARQDCRTSVEAQSKSENISSIMPSSLEEECHRPLTQILRHKELSDRQQIQAKVFEHRPAAPRCDVKRGNSLGEAPQEGARQECRTSVTAWGKLRRKERDRSAGRAWMGCEAWK